MIKIISFKFASYVLIYSFPSNKIEKEICDNRSSAKSLFSLNQLYIHILISEIIINIEGRYKYFV